MRITDIYDRFITFCDTWDIKYKDTKIIAAISGGSDSMLMLNLLYGLHKKGDISLYAFHLNHMLRAQADEEEAFVCGYCEERGIPVKSAKVDIKAYAKENGISEETAGRQVRYSLLGKFREEVGADYIATAHHADDNAETVIMRLVRGTSVDGLCGILPKNGDIIRPVLFLSKDQIVDICESENIPYVTDMSNFDNKYFRNRIRNNVIPLLKSDNPSFTDSVRRMSESMTEVKAFIERMTDSVPLEYSVDSVNCLRHYLLGADKFIVSQVIMKMCRVLTAGKDIGRVHIEKLTSLVLTGDVRWEYRIPGLWVYMYDGVLSISSREVKKTAQSYEYTVNCGEEQYFPEQNLRILTKIIKKDENFCINSYIKAVDYDKITDRLFIVSRKDGMKFRPAGKVMTKKISRYFSDMKLPMALRDRIPIFMCGDDIVCVGNMDVDEKYRITEDTQNILTISVIYEGENTDETYEG